MRSRDLSATRAFVQGAWPVVVLVACGAASPKASSPMVTVSPALPSASLVLPDAPDAGSSSPDTGAASTEPAVDESPTSDDHGGEIDDGAESPMSSTPGPAYPHPLDGVSPQKLAAELAQNPEGLGSMSVGYTNGGALVNGVQMPTDERWELVDPNRAWGTRETVDYLTHCLDKVSHDLPGGPKMYIGHISAEHGGRLSPHISHQAGRDVDVSYYYLPGESRWYATARANNLDRERTWAFVKDLVTDTDVELILMDRSVQQLVRQYATKHGEDSQWVDQIFDGAPGLPPLIRHAKGHATHIHVRFYNPLAQETGRRLYDLLLATHRITVPARFVHHKVKEGETLGQLAKKYGVSPQSIQGANGMKSNLLRAARDYKIPLQGGAKDGGMTGCPRMTVIPARRMPPERRSG